MSETLNPSINKRLPNKGVVLTKPEAKRISVELNTLWDRKFTEVVPYKDGFRVRTHTIGPIVKEQYDAQAKEEKNLDSAVFELPETYFADIFGQHNKTVDPLEDNSVTIDRNSPARILNPFTEIPFTHNGRKFESLAHAYVSYSKGRVVEYEYDASAVEEALYRATRAGTDDIMIDVLFKSLMKKIGKQADSFLKNYRNDIVFEETGFENFTKAYTNVLNTYRDSLVKTKESPSDLSPISGIQSNKSTLAKVYKAAEDMGISIVSMAEYNKSHKKITGADAVADLTNKVIALSHGQEDIVTEEVVHIATSMLEQTNPAMITKLISRIHNFNVFKTTMAEYKDNDLYKLPNGRPNIRKIKKEAVDRLIAQAIMSGGLDTTTNPELLIPEARDEVKTWWSQILNAIKSLYARTDVNLFNDAADIVMSGTLEGSTAEGGLFLHISEEENAPVEKHFKDVLNMSNDLILYEDGTIENPKRHYTYKGEVVDYSVTEFIKIGKNMADIEQSPKNKVFMEYGSAGHKYIEDFILKNLIDDKTGLRKETFENNTIAMEGRQLNDEAREALEIFAKDLIEGYPQGTRFMIEPAVINTRYKKTVASKVDFMAIVPTVNKEGKPDIKVDQLDWKFTTVRPGAEDHYSMKKEGWQKQMNEYVKIQKNMGLTSAQMGKSRMVPFIFDYGHITKDTPLNKIAPRSIETATPDEYKYSELYLLPVPTENETTGIAAIDNLVGSLNAYYKNVKSSKVNTPDERTQKQEILADLSKAIRRLQVNQSFADLTKVAHTFISRSSTTLENVHNELVAIGKDPAKKINSVSIGKLRSIEASLDKFESLDAVFKESYSEGLSAEQKQTLVELEKISKKAEVLKGEINKVYQEVTGLAYHEQGFSSYENREEVLKPEREVNKVLQSFTEFSKLRSKIGNVISKIVQVSKSKVNVEFKQKMKTYDEILASAEAEAKASGKELFDMVAKEENGSFRLQYKLNKPFLDAFKESMKEQDMKSFKKMVNVGELEKSLKEALKAKITYIKDGSYSVDPTENAAIITKKISQAEKELNMDHKYFNGWSSWTFKKAARENIKEDAKSFSEEYKAMQKSPGVLKMWEYLRDVNQEAINAGYLEASSASFFPLIEGNVIERMSQAESKVGETKDFFKDMYTANIEEVRRQSNLDPETGEVKKTIPKFYTHLGENRQLSQMSKDMTKLGPLWTKAVMDYTASKEVEDIALMMHTVEKNKGSLLLEDGMLVEEHGEFKTKTENATADLIMDYLNDTIYMKDDSSDEFLNTAVRKASKDNVTDEEVENKTLSAKKVISVSNTWLQALAVGLKPAIMVANYIGQNALVFINSGGYYTMKEHMRNNAKYLSGRISTEERALLDTFIPLNDDIAEDSRRITAWKTGGFLSYINTFSFSDIMQSTNHFPERALAHVNGLSMLENTVVINGKLMNARSVVRARNREAFEKNSSPAFRLEKKNSFKADVAALIESDGIQKSLKISDKGVEIEGVSNEEIAKLRLSIIDFGRKLNGQIDQNNKAAYRRNVIFRGFMMFKNWMPKLVEGRFGGLKKSVEQGEWEQGRMSLWFNTVRKVGVHNVFRLESVITGTEAGAAIIDEMLEARRAEHKAKYGTDLEITREEYAQVVEMAIHAQTRELVAVLGMVGLVIAGQMAEPPEDPLERNRQKFVLKLLNKASDELLFFYDPTVTSEITRGSILPSLSLLSSAKKALVSVGQLGYATVTGDETLRKDTHAVKSIGYMIPGIRQMLTEVLPVLDQELAKELGIRTTDGKRRG